MSREVIALLLCACSAAETCPAEGVIERARATDATHVELALRCSVVPDGVTIESYERAGGALAVSGVHGSGRRVVVDTAMQRALASYTVTLDGARGPDGRPVAASANFVGVGELESAAVTLSVDDRYDGRLAHAAALVSIDPVTGVFSEFSALVPLADPDGDHVFTASLRVAVDPLRTVSTNDDRLGAGRQAYAARAVDTAGGALSPLVTFEVRSAAAAAVDLPLLSRPRPPGPEGLTTVRVRVDDTPARALRDPRLRASTDAAGGFDPSFPTTLPLADDDGDHVWEASARVRIDPSRKKGGTTSETFPYVVFVQSGGVDYPSVGVEVEALTEAEVAAAIRVGDPRLVPVTFRADVSAAYLDATGSRRGLFPGDAPYLTGEFGLAQDAFGQNAADAFSGGENVVLEMAPRLDHAGVWERTLFLPPSRTYGWKIVRCPSGKGCAELNRHVTSSGRAFATVMKNLATENRDTQTASGVAVVDPRAPRVGALDYSGAQVYRGLGMGVEPNPAGLPDPARLFKQELPDLVVEVGTGAVATPVIVVGTWRDVNLPKTIGEIVLSSGSFDLNPWDYDSGFVGSAPPSYALPEPSPFVVGDGKADPLAVLVPGGGPATMTLRAAVRGHTLYVATEATGAGSDHFVIVSVEPPGAPRPAPWGKAGQVAFPASALFLAAENDGDFAGWFRLADGSRVMTGVEIARAGVLEGTVDLEAAFDAVPETLYLAVAPYASADGGAIYPGAQMPATQDLDGDIDAAEIAAVPVGTLR